MAKKLILADQYQYDSKLINKLVNNLNAQESVNQLADNNHSYDANDFALDNKSTIRDRIY